MPSPARPDERARSRTAAWILPLAIAALPPLFVSIAFALTWADEACTPRLVALMYHRFVPDAAYPSLRGKPRVYSIPETRFREQMQHLRDRGYHAVTLQQALDLAAGRINIPQPAVLITIDDGCRSVLTRAAPILAQLHLPATLFLTTDPAAPVFDSSDGEKSQLSSADLSRLITSNFDLAAHGHTHRPLRDLPDANLHRELLDSRAAVESTVAQPCRAMAVPGNWYNDRVLRSARDAGYEAVFTSDPGSIRPGSDPLRLPRINIPGYMSLDRFDAALKPFGMARRRFLRNLSDRLPAAFQPITSEWLAASLTESTWPLWPLLGLTLLSPALAQRLRRRAIAALTPSDASPATPR